MGLFQENVVVLDRGSHRLRALLVRRGLGTFDILKKETLPAIAPPHGDAEAAGYNLLRFIQTLFPEESVFYLPVNASELYVRNIDLPTENAKLAAEILPGDLEALLPVPLEDVEIVSQCWQVGDGQSRMTAFAVENRQIEELSDPVVKSGKTIGYLAPAPHLLASAVHLLPSQEVTGKVTGQLDIGLHGTLFNVLYDGKLAFSRLLPIGGADFTEEIAAQLGISEEDAERFKLESGIDLSLKGAAEIQTGRGTRTGHSSARLQKMKQGLQKLVRELAREIERSILASPLRDPGHVYLSGGGSLLRGLSDVLEEETNLRFRRYPLLLAEEGVEQWILCLGALHASGAGKKDSRLDLLQTGIGSRLKRGEIRWKPFMIPGILSAAAMLILLLSFVIGIVNERNQLQELNDQMQEIAKGIPGIGANQNPVIAARAICQNRLRVMRSVLGGYRTLDILKEVTDHTVDRSQASLKLKTLSYDESAIELDLEVDNVNQIVAIQERYQSSKMFSAVEVVRSGSNPTGKGRLGLKLVLKPVSNNVEVNCR